MHLHVSWWPRTRTICPVTASRDRFAAWAKLPYSIKALGCRLLDIRSHPAPRISLQRCDQQASYLSHRGVPWAATRAVQKMAPSWPIRGARRSASTCQRTQKASLHILFKPWCRWKAQPKAQPPVDAGDGLFVGKGLKVDLELGPGQVSVPSFGYQGI